ncbi:MULTISPECIES: hypothetical protein [unclassified Leisingera]|uniref:hypothetical protein n=2 Tax=Leisingera TaxID=191028 RepID=UPI0002F3115B|nr:MULTISPECIES: hypothetical protein [unclassified Leisingera]KIC24298.1 hypothetical protein RA23_11525 [Leisingera sp. ANG-S3]KID10086.1 hypothetical protein GC1_05950 [Leisingera sp. ANG1]
MPLDASAAKEIKQQMTLARKRALSFGLCFGKKIENSVFLTHKTKAAKVLGKQAKSDGETPQFSFGTLKLDGKELSMSVEGKIVPGMARKAKKMFMVVGLKYKILILDPSGNVVESEADDEDETAEDVPQAAPAASGDTATEASAEAPAAPSAEPDPAEAKWKTTAAKVETNMAKLRDIAGIDLSKAETLWKAIQAKAEGSGFTAALEHIAKLSAEMKTAAQDAAARAKRQSLLEGKWQQAAAKLEPLIDEVLALKTAQSEKIETVWTQIKARVAASPPDYEGALKAVGPLAQAISKARQTATDAGGGEAAPASTEAAAGGDTATATKPEAPAKAPEQAAPPSGDTGSETGDATVDEQIARIEAALKALKDGPVKTYNTMVPEAVSQTPDKWKAALDKVAALAAQAKAKPEDASDAKLDAGEKALDALEKAVAADTQAKTAFQKALEIFDLRMVPLTSHPKATAPEIAPEITRITGLRTAAADKAKAHDLKTATADLTAAEAEIAKAEILADEFAHFMALDPDRKALADAARGVTVGDPAVDDAAREMERLYDAAQQDKAAKKFKDGIQKLDEVAKVYERTAKVRKQRKLYEDWRPKVKQWIDHWAGLTAAIKNLLKDKLDEAKGYYTDSDVATSKDYTESIKLLSKFWGLLPFLKKEIPVVQQYAPKLTAFEAKLKEFKDHDGASGIQVIILKMEADLASAKAEAVLHKYSTALTLLDATQGDWPAATAQADACKAYKEKRVAVQGKIDPLKNVPQAATMLEDAKALMAEAAAAALKLDFTTASNCVADAEKRADSAKAAAEAAVELDGMTDTAALDDLKKNWDPAFKVFTDVRDKVVAADTGNDFTALIAKAQLPAAEAEKAKTAKKFDDARAHLDSAISNLKMAMVLIHQHRAYGELKASLAAQIAALAPLNDANCLQPHIDDANKLSGEADDLIKPEGYDYKGGEAKIAAARKIVEEARADGELFKTIKADRTKAAAIIAKITTEGGDVEAQLTHRKTEVQDLLDESTSKQTARDFKGAAEKAKAAAGWEKATDEDLKNLKTVLGWETPFFKTPRATLIGPGKEAGVHQIARADADFAKYEAMKAAHTYSAALRMFEKAYQKIEACKLLIAAAAPYNQSVTDAQAAVDALAPENNDATKDRIKAMADRLTAAKLDLARTDLDSNDYTQAIKLLKQITEDAKALLQSIKGSSDYEPARAAAEAKLAEARGHKHADAIQAQLTRLTAKYDNLVKLAPSDYATAKTMAEEVTKSAEEAISSANTHGILEAVNSAIGGDEDSAPWWPQVQAAKLSIKAVGSRENAGVAKTHLDTANTEIENCQKDGLDAKIAKGHLKAALEACNTANEVISQYAFIAQEIVRARATLPPVTGHAEAAYVKDETDAVEKLLDGAETAAKGGQNYAKVSSDIEAAIAQTKIALEMAGQHKQYKELRAKPEVEPRLAVLEKHEHRYAIKPSIDTMRKKLGDAAAAVAGKKPGEGVKLLEEARAIGTSAFVMAEMRANTPPKEDDIKEILSRPNGTAELDAMIDNLEPEAQRAVVKVAFKARFGCDIKNFSNENLAPASEIADNNLKGPNIVAFYKAMQDLPLDHTLNNDSLQSFAVNEAAKGGSKYQSDKKRIVMHEGDAGASPNYAFGSDDAVGSLDDAATPEERAELEKCKPANEEPVTFFNWNTLHEVGHAVDDKQSFMKNNGKKKDFGGWTEHGMDISGIADKIAKKFSYDTAYVTEYMAHNKSAHVPPRPEDETCSDEDWESRRIKMEAFVDMASEPAKPWSSMATAKKLAIGGVVYQESYPNSWNSYLLSERAKGITGYQFRAPGEWFSELYAAFHSGKLKPNHPAVGWLEKL